MPKKINLTIPQPCHENWKDMIPTDKGRFCASCQKNVVDFSQSSDRQIVEAIRKDDDICGRFTDSQLERELSVPKGKSTVWVAASTTVISFLTATIQADAQTSAPVEQRENDIYDMVSKATAIDTLKISGIVSDKSGPIEMASVYVDYKKKVYTDSLGRFTLTVQRGDIVTFSRYEHESREIKADSAGEYSIILKKLPHRSYRMGRVARRRTLVGHWLYSINIFRIFR